MMLVDTEPQHMQALRIANDRRVAAGAIRRELTAGTITIGRALEDERSGSLRAIAIVMTQPRIGRDRAAAILRWQRIPEDTMVRRLTHRRRALIAAAFGDVYDPSVAPSVEPPLGSDAP